MKILKVAVASTNNKYSVSQALLSYCYIFLKNHTVLF